MLSFEPNASPFLMARAPERGAPGRNLEWGARCADAEEVEGRGGCTLRSLGTSADRDATRRVSGRIGRAFARDEEQKTIDGSGERRLCVNAIIGGVFHAGR